MKKVLIVLAVALLTIGTLSAQTAATTAAPAKPASDIKVFAFEMGTGFSYNIFSTLMKPTQNFSAVYGFNDVVQAGFSIIKGGASSVAGSATANDYALVKLSIYPITDLGVSLLFGSSVDTAVAAGAAQMATGLGIGYNVLRNSSASGLTTALQISGQYLCNDITKGNVCIGMNLKIGY